MRQKKVLNPYGNKDMGTSLLPVHFRRSQLILFSHFSVPGFENSSSVPFFFLMHLVPAERWCFSPFYGHCKLPVGFLCVVFSSSPKFVLMQGFQPCVISKGCVQWFFWSWRKCAQQLWDSWDAWPAVDGQSDSCCFQQLSESLGQFLWYPQL